VWSCSDVTEKKIFSLAECFSGCQCSGGVISLQEGTVDSEAIALFNGNDKTAMEYYTQYFVKNLF